MGKALKLNFDVKTAYYLHFNKNIYFANKFAINLNNT